MQKPCLIKEELESGLVACPLEDLTSPISNCEECVFYDPEKEKEN